MAAARVRMVSREQLLVLAKGMLELPDQSLDTAGHVVEVCGEARQLVVSVLGRPDGEIALGELGGDTIQFLDGYGQPAAQHEPHSEGDERRGARDQDGSELHAAHRCEGLRCRAFHHDRPFDALNRGHRAEELGRRIIALDGVGAGQPERRRGAEKILDQWGFRGVAADGALFGCCDDPPGSVHQPDQEPAAGAVFQALLHRAQIEHPGQRAPRGFAVGGQRVGDHGRQGAGGGVEAAAGDAVQRLSVGRADYPLEGAPAGVIEAGVAGEGALTAAVHDLEVHHRPTEVRGGLGERLGESFGADRGIGLDDPPGGLETGLVTGDGQ
jgi:hypothetical protein